MIDKDSEINETNWCFSLQAYRELENREMVMILPWGEGFSGRFLRECSFKKIAWDTCYISFERHERVDSKATRFRFFVCFFWRYFAILRYRWGSEKSDGEKMR